MGQKIGFGTRREE